MTKTDLVTNEIEAYQPFKQQLNILVAENKNMVFDYESKKGNTDARSHVYKLRQSKGAVEKVRVEQKAASLEVGRQIDGQARDIKEKFDAMIEVHAEPLRKIAEKEATRIEAINNLLARFPREAEVYPDLPSVMIKARINSIQALELSEKNFAEFLDKAGVAKDRALNSLRASLSASLKSEGEAAELARLREESAKREQKDRDDRIALKASQKAEQDAKDAAEKVEAETKAYIKAEKDASERRELQLKLDAETAKREAAEAIQRAKDETAAAAKLEQELSDKRAANKAHREKIIKAAVDDMKAQGVEFANAKKIIGLIVDGKISNVTVSF